MPRWFLCPSFHSSFFKIKWKYPIFYIHKEPYIVGKTIIYLRFQQGRSNLNPFGHLNCFQSLCFHASKVATKAVIFLDQ